MMTPPQEEKAERGVRLSGRGGASKEKARAYRLEEGHSSSISAVWPASRKGPGPAREDRGASVAPLWAPLGSLAQGSWSLPQSPVARAHFVQSFVPVRRGGLEALNEVVAHVTGESRRFPSGRGLSAPSVLSV